MKRKIALAAGVSWLALASPALAQEDPRDALIRELAARLEAVEAQLGDLKEAGAADVADVRRIVAEAPQVTLANGRPSLALSSGVERFAIRGLIQFDAADYAEGRGNPTDLSSGTNFRRARLGVEGTIGHSWNWNITGEFGGSGGEAAGLNQAWVEYAGWKPWQTSQAAPLRLRVGAWATATNLEDATSNTESLFLERPAAAELVRGIAGGDGRTGIGVFANGDRWQTSAVLTGAVVGTPTTAEFDEQAGYLLRASYLVARAPEYGVHVGLNASGIIEPADTAAGPAVTRNVRLRERPELRVDGTRLVDTGNIAANEVSQRGVELGGFFNNLYLAGEYIQFDVDRSGPGAPVASFDGWYVQGAWALTGEKRAWSAANGGFQGIRPTANFDPAAKTWGAWEIAARYSVLDLNDNEGAAGFATPVNGVRGGEQRITTVGLNWYPNRTVRFLLDYQWAEVDRLNGAGAEIGEDFQALSLRTQVAF